MTPKKAYEKCFKFGTRDPRLETIILQSQEYIYRYALEVIEGRWPEGEITILQSPEHTCRYALDVIKDQWTEGEVSILQEPKYTYW